ncbi:MAG: AMP-binding protein [Bacteroidaceae bacterium]|nr:AMP-binding protein [Bacteroidaceae bacterium]
MKVENFIKLFENSVKRDWDKLALSEYRKSDITYRELAEDLEKFKILWKAAGLGRGDKVVINARSCTHWIEVFMAAVSGSFVSVQLFNGFLPKDVQQLVNHSEGKILYTEKNLFKSMDFESMPGVIAAIDTETLEILASRGSFEKAYSSVDKLFKEKYPNGMTPDDISFDIPEMDEVCAIMYTSGSTGNPKGVMLTVRNFSWNVHEIPNHFPYQPEENYTSILPYAHIFGLTCDVIIPMCMGMHDIILGMPPIPSNVSAIMQDYHPRIFLAVPLILSKFVEYAVGAEMKSAEGREKLEHYKENREYCDMLRDKVLAALGGRIEAFATGGAAIPPQIEALLAFQINMPFITGYGITECAPVIAIGHRGSYKAKSCGEYVPSLNVKIDSIDPENIPGEILVKGDNVFAGYFKNPEATKATFTEDGWFKTGDIGTMDKDTTLFISGRCKNMLLSSNGQNIFPEEIEVVLNTLPYVAESIIVQRENFLHAIIVVDANKISENNLDSATLNKIMEGNLKKLNSAIPSYSSVSSYEIRLEPFAKTPKGSIRRFMYT